jgi:hypothetical protein
MCQELQIFAFVCMYLDASWVSLDYRLDIIVIKWKLLLMVDIEAKTL